MEKRITEKHFNCTACGECCRGWLPLTLNDAIAHAGRFPLALVWTPVRQETRAFALTAQLGAKIKTRNRKFIATLIVPTAYIPPAFSCPALTASGLCAIQEIKPARCRTMPFYPYREEENQADMLVPRKNWKCDISATAPVVYRDRKIINRECFNYERGQLLEQAPVMRSYAEYMLKYTPHLGENLADLAINSSGNIITSLSSFLTAIKSIDATWLAQQQLPVLNDYATQTATNSELLEYHHNYAGWAKEMAYLAQRNLMTAL